jgi:hypothetical protein
MVYLGSTAIAYMNVPRGRRKLLYTARLSVFKSIKRKMKPYYLMRNRGNDVVVPDRSDFDQYHGGVMSWEGFKVNYLAKLMRTEAEEWMKRVSVEAVRDDVVLVSDEERYENCYRILLAEMMINMFSGRMSLYYKGDIRRNEDLR